MLHEGYTMLADKSTRKPCCRNETAPRVIYITLFHLEFPDDSHRADRWFFATAGSEDFRL